jgi:hypothetical protein
MTKPVIQIGNEAREMNEVELAQYKTDKAADEAAIKTQDERATARQAVLDRLGITADEAALLLG